MSEHTKSVFESNIWKDDRKYNGRMTDNTMEGRQTIEWKNDKQYNSRVSKYRTSFLSNFDL